MKTMWVTIFKCFHCGKNGHDLIKCHQCEEAYYCDGKCEAAHSKVHAKVCVAMVTAKAQHAHRERIARAVREKGKDNVEGGEEDELCVICQSKPAAPVQVSSVGLSNIFLKDWKRNESKGHEHNNPSLTNSCRVATSTARRALRSCAKKAWTNRARFAASPCRPGRRSSSIWVSACV